MARDIAIDFDRCEPARLSTFLSLAASPQTLDDLLATRPLTLTVARLLTELCDERESATGEELLHAVATPAAPLAELRALKERAKVFAARAARPEHRCAATFLYHAAIAAAAAYHDAEISSLPLIERRALYARIARALGDDPLAAVFARAAAEAPR